MDLTWFVGTRTKTIRTKTIRTKTIRTRGNPPRKKIISAPPPFTPFSAAKTFVFLLAFVAITRTKSQKSSPRHLLLLFSPRQNLRVSQSLSAFVATLTTKKSSPRNLLNSFLPGKNIRVSSCLRGNHPHQVTKIISAPPPFTLFSAAKPSCFLEPQRLRGNSHHKKIISA